MTICATQSKQRSPGSADDPGYGALLDGWTEIALAQIGREATVVRDPLPDGGVIATLGDRRVAYTLTALAENQVARLADKVGALWTVSRVGRVERINGPVVHVSGLGPVSRFDLVEVGEQRLPGETVSLDGDRAVVQLYEYTGGLRVGEPARAAGRPLSAWLGPGLLGGLFDGLLRPLEDAPDFLLPRSLETDRDGRWPFTPRAKVGDEVGAGDVIGTIVGGTVEHRVMVPPGVAGTLTWIATEGDVAAAADIATVGETGVPLISDLAGSAAPPVRGAVLRSGAVRDGPALSSICSHRSRWGAVRRSSVASVRARRCCSNRS